MLIEQLILVVDKSIRHVYHAVLGNSKNFQGNFNARRVHWAYLATSAPLTKQVKLQRAHRNVLVERGACTWDKYLSIWRVWTVPTVNTQIQWGNLRVSIVLQESMAPEQIK